MPVTSYYTVNGEIIAEHTTGQSRLDYLTDGLGSVVATVDQTLTVQSTARYKPYGAHLSTSGTLPDFGWIGSRGYRAVGLSHGDICAGARTIATIEGSWTTLDPNWALEPENGFCYAANNPTTFVGLPGSFASGHPVATNCQIPNSKKVPGEFGISCSQGKTTGISADFTVPRRCEINCRDDYINFYLSMEGHEGGVSFKYRGENQPGSGWEAFLNDFGHQQNKHVPNLGPGVTVSMSLMLTNGIALLTVNNVKIQGTIKGPDTSTAKTVAGAGVSGMATCPIAYSNAAWNNVVLHGGDMKMRKKAIKSGATRIVRDFPLITSLRTATSLCNKSQFDYCFKSTKPNCGCKCRCLCVGQQC